MWRKPKAQITINEEPVDLDGLNYLAGKDVDFINKSAMNGTILAHTDGDVPNLMFTIPEQNEFYLGELFYTYEFACGVSGNILGVNPFDQPGVESYKKNMFALLGKPGYEAMTDELLERLKQSGFLSVGLVIKISRPLSGPAFFLLNRVAELSNMAAGAVVLAVGVDKGFGLFQVKAAIDVHIFFVGMDGGHFCHKHIVAPQL